MQRLVNKNHFTITNFTYSENLHYNNASPFLYSKLVWYFLNIQIGEDTNTVCDLLNKKILNLIPQI